MKVIRSERRERAQEDNYDMQETKATEPEFNKPRSLSQLKKQNKLQRRKKPVDMSPLHKKDKPKIPLRRTLHEPEFITKNKVKANRFYKNF
jgi:hypothetical protein